MGGSDGRVANEDEDGHSDRASKVQENVYEVLLVASSVLRESISESYIAFRFLT